MVVTRHEGEDPSVTHLRRVDQVRKQFVPKRNFVVFRMGDEDIWVTPDHPFFEMGTGLWISAANVTTSHSLQVLKGKGVKLQDYLKASQLLASADEANDLVAVYDLSVHEYDRYSVGKQGLLVSACNDSTDLAARDKQVWGEMGYPNIGSGSGKTEEFKAKAEGDSVQAEEEFDSSGEEDHSDTNQSGLSSAAVIGGTLGIVCLLLVSILLIRSYRNKANSRKGQDLDPLIASTSQI